MTSRGRTYTLRIVGDVKDATSAIDKTSGKFGGALGKIGAVAGGFIAAEAVGKVVAFGAETVTMASDVEQSVGAVESIYKGFSDDVIASSESAATAVGLSEGEYLKLASTLGGQLKNAGVPLEDIAGQTDGLIAQAADLAATYGGTTTEAVEALGSAMRGESDPAERYALNLKQSAIQAEAVEEGITKQGEAMTDTERVMAMMSLTAEQGADAQGAFARESDTLAGKQQRLGAQFDNVKTTIGQALLPAVSGALDLFQKLIKWVTDNWPKMYKVIKPVIDKVKTLVGFVVKFLAQVWEKYGPVVMKVVKWIGTVIGSTFKTIFKILGNVIDFIKNIFQGKWKAAFQNVLNIFENIWDHVKTILAKPIEWLRNLVESIGTWISNKWNTIWDRVKNTVDNVIDWIKGVPEKIMTYLGNIATKVTNWITNTWQGLWDDVKTVVTDIWEDISSAISDAWDGIVSAIEGVWDSVTGAVKSGINLVIRGINTVIGGINSAIDLANKLPGVNIGHIGTIPELARGGIVTGPTIAMLGERGAEAVIPLSRGGALGSVYNITVNAGVGDPVAIGRSVVDAIGAYERSAGRRWREVSGR